MPRRRRRPSIFDAIWRRMMEGMERGFPPFREERKSFEEELREPFEDITKIFEREIPKGFEEFVREEETPYGKVRKYGPFVYGFTYTQRPGEEPEFKEFGNVRSGTRGRIEPLPEGEREPLTDVMDLDDKYEVTVEVPGVEKEEIDLTSTEDTMKIETTGERKYKKEISFDEPIDSDKIDATFRNGVLTLVAEKKEVEKKPKGKKIDVK